MNASDGSSSRFQGKKRHVPEASVHMSVLGMDGTDHEMDAAMRRPSQDHPNQVKRMEGDNEQEHESNQDGGAASPPILATKRRAQQSPSNNMPAGEKGGRLAGNTSTASDKPSWWGKILWGRRGDEDEDDEASTQYRSLETPEGDDPTSSLTQMMMGGKRKRNLSSSSLVASSTSTNTATVEDRLKKDCSFFYQGVEDSENAATRHSHPNSFSRSGDGLRPLSAALQQQVPSYLSSRESARFYAWYERLNQDTVLVDTDDLVLDEYQSNWRGGGHTSDGTEVIDFSSTATTSQNTGKLSSLFFEQDGRLLMKLPTDQVRLIMDQDLEPGIISVEQWRKVDKNHFSPVGPAVGNDNMMMILEEGGIGATDNIVKSSSQRPPPLRYVMTVPDDLYRRVVAEMSYALLPPCWGFFKCCNDPNGKADIKLALIILAVILFLMFISTMEWPTD